MTLIPAAFDIAFYSFMIRRLHWYLGKEPEIIRIPRFLVSKLLLPGSAFCTKGRIGLNPFTAIHAILFLSLSIRVRGLLLRYRFPAKPAEAAAFRYRGAAVRTFS